MKVRSALLVGIAAIGLSVLFLLACDTQLAVADNLPSLPAYASGHSLRADSSLRAVAFSPNTNKPTGIAVGDRGAIFRSTDQGMSWKPVFTSIDCQLDDVVWINDQTAVIVGGNYDSLTRLSRGVVLTSNDGGTTWTTIKHHDLARLRSINGEPDGSLHAIGDWSHSQLSDHFVSRDRGRTWQGLSGDEQLENPIDASQASKKQTATSFVQWLKITGVSAPIRDACRVSSSRLCAVGDHGMILVSDDEGESWQSAKGRDRSTGILFIAGNAASVPWSLLGSESLQWRNRVEVLLEHPDAALDSTVVEIDLVRQATMLLGGGNADWFRNPHVQENESNTPASLQAKRWIAIHQPTVVVIDESASTETTEAVFQAAAASGVSRILKSSLGRNGGSMLHQNAMLPKIGLLAGDLTMDALHLLKPNQAFAQSVSLKRMYDSGSSRLGGGGESVTSGLPMRSEARLTADPKSISRHRLQVVQARMKQYQQLESLLDSRPDPASFAKSFKLLLDQTSAADQLRSAWHVHLRTNETILDDETLAEIANRFKNHSLGSWAKVIQHARATSAERTSLAIDGRATASESQLSAATADQVPVSPFQTMGSMSLGHSPSAEKPFTYGSYLGGVQQASAIIPVGIANPEVIHANLSSEPGFTSNQVDLQFEFHPAVVLARLASKKDIESGDADANATSASDEDRIAVQGQRDWRSLLGSASGRTILIRHTMTPPRLDGMLDDACWNFAPSAMESGVQIRVAFDNDYVYVAAQCPSKSLPVASSQTKSNRRVRDQFLDEVSRLRIRFDTDRDLWTSHCIEITADGRTRDSTDRDPAWQPTWYFDIDRGDESTMFEIAIRRTDLGDVNQRNKTQWFVSAQIATENDSVDSSLFPNPAAWHPAHFQQPVPKRLTPVR